MGLAAGADVASVIRFPVERRHQTGAARLAAEKAVVPIRPVAPPFFGWRTGTVNYYEHHLGDYDGATAHLSWLEDCAYRRLLTCYYRNESPIPADIKQACRLVRATTKQERAAVESVLREFFHPTDDGWRNARCDAEIDRFKEKASKARSSANARWSGKQTHREYDANALRTHNGSPCQRNANALPTQCEGNALQTPDTRREDSESLRRLRDSGVPPIVASAPEPPEDPLKTLWKLGVSILGEDARTAIGKAIKRVGPGKVGEVLGYMAVRPPADPMPYFQRATQERGVQV